MLKDYVEAYKHRDTEGRLYLRILNGKLKGQLKKEKERIERIVRTWGLKEPLEAEDLERLNAVGETKLRRKVQWDWRVHTTTSCATRTRSDIAYQELHEAIVEWSEGEKDRVRPRQCAACTNWFVPAPQGRIGIYCSRNCDQKASNQRNAAQIAATVREGRKKGEYA